MAQSAPSSSSPAPGMMPKKASTARKYRGPYTTTSVAKPSSSQPNKVTPIKLAEPEHRRAQVVKLVPSSQTRSAIIPDKVISHTVKRGVAVAAYIRWGSKHYHTLLNPATGRFEAKSLTMTDFDLSSLIQLKTASEAQAAPSKNRHVKKEPVKAPAKAQTKKKR